MKKIRPLAVISLALALAAALPVQAADADPSFEVVEGRVIQIDLEDTRVTLQGSDGTLHEFKASSETLKGLKVGDWIEAKRRPKTSARD